METPEEREAARHEDRAEELRRLGPEHVAQKAKHIHEEVVGLDLFGKMLNRPWCCPEPRCLPLWQVRDSSSEPLAKPQPGQSWACWGRLGRTVEFEYDGVMHANDLRSCFYTALKGVVSWHETADDWMLMEDGYHMAAARLRHVLETRSAGEDG